MQLKFTSLQKDFFDRIGKPLELTGLFEHLPDVYLFIKDRHHRFVKVNQAFVVLHGCSDEGEVIGLNDFDFHPPSLAQQYQDEDRNVMETGKPIINQVWLVPRMDGTPCWYLCTKLPLTGKRNQVIGLAGFLTPYDRAISNDDSMRRLAVACDFVLQHYSEPITIRQMADQASLSISQMQREFKRLFSMSPKEYVLRVRLSMAQRMLLDSARPFQEIAMACGFYDQSHFNRVFRSETGLTPRAYQTQFRLDGFHQSSNRRSSRDSTSGS